MVSIVLLVTQLPQPSICKNHNYLQNATQQSAIKQGIPYFILNTIHLKTNYSICGNSRIDAVNSTLQHLTLLTSLSLVKSPTSDTEVATQYPHSFFTQSQSLFWGTVIQTGKLQFSTSIHKYGLLFEPVLALETQVENRILKKILVC